MKTILLLLLGASAMFFAGCETDLPPEPGKPPVSFSPGQSRDEFFERAIPVATPLQTDAR